MTSPLPAPPPFMTVRKASKILRWGWETTYNWAYENNLIVKIGDREFISVHRLRREFPDVFVEIAGDED